MPNNKINASNDPVLDRIVKGYTPVGFIRPLVLPSISVTADKGDILQAGDTHYSIHNNVRSARSTTPELEFSMSVQSGWNIKKYGLKTLVTEEDGNGFNPMNPRAGFQTAKNQFTVMIRQAQMVAAENALASVVTNETNFSASNKVTLSGTDQYNDFANSDPIGDALTACDAVYDATGLRPNTAVMSWKVFKQLQYNVAILNLIGNDTNKVSGISTNQLAVALQVDKVVVGSAMKNTASKGQTAVKSPIWPKSLLYTYVNPNPSPMQFEDTFGYTFQKTAVMADNYAVLDPKNAVYCRVVEDYDDVILNFDSGYLISDAVA